MTQRTAVVGAAWSPMTDSPTRTPVPLFVDDAGPHHGLPVVLLHAAAGDGTQYAPQLAHLRTTRRALAFDLRGHGRSPRATSFAIEDAGADVVAALAALHVERFVIVGHSWGGAVATAVAGLVPERVAGLLLLDPATDARLMPKEVADGLMHGLHTAYDATVAKYYDELLAAARPEVRTRLLATIAAAPKEVVIGTLESMLTFDPVTPLSRYHGPKRSVISPLGERPDAYHHRVPDLPATLVEGVGHWLQLDAPERVNAELDAFLAVVDRAAP